MYHDHAVTYITVWDLISIDVYGLKSFMEVFFLNTAGTLP